MADTYLFDSYALVEILKGNPNYEEYVNAAILTTKLNIFEVYHGLLRDFGEKEARGFLADYYRFVIDFDEEIIAKAAAFRLENRKRNISMTDCIGYILAFRWGVPFLTGDKEFADVQGVEFVK